MEVFPLPKFQFQAVGLPVDWSWKFTTRGVHPAKGKPLKLATGACPEVLVAPKQIITQKASFVMVWMVKRFKLIGYSSGSP